MHKAKEIDNKDLSIEEKIRCQFEALRDYYPEFASCQNSTMLVLRDASLNQPNMIFNKCVINRVYNREDKNKEAILYVYVRSEDDFEKFYIADKSSGSFLEMDREEFINQYECYEMDLKKNNWIRPYEDVEFIKCNKNMDEDGRVI